MNIAAMALLTALIFAEKVFPPGARIAQFAERFLTRACERDTLRRPVLGLPYVFIKNSEVACTKSNERKSQ